MMSPVESFRKYQFVYVQQRGPQYPLEAGPLAFVVEDGHIVLEVVDAPWLGGQAPIRIAPFGESGVLAEGDAAATAKRLERTPVVVDLFEVKYRRSPVGRLYVVNILSVDRDRLYGEYIDWKMAGRPTPAP
jgi:hypothetical protein